MLLPKMHLASHQVESTGSKWLQMAMAMAMFQLCPKYSQMVPNCPKLSTMIKHSPKFSNMAQECPKWS